MPEEIRKYSIDADIIFEKLKKVVEKARFQIDRVDETNRRLILSTGISLLSYGEDVEIIVSREKDNTSKVFVSSKPKVWFNITAFPNAKRNVQRIFELLESEI
jgi:hypothetical protein